MSDASVGRHRGEAKSRHHVARAFGYLVLTITLVIGLFSVYTYRMLTENIHTEDLTEQLGTDRPEEVEVEGPKDPLNIMVMGTDTRDGEGNAIDRHTGNGNGLSDTTFVLHLSADRSFAYGVSLPRDGMVQRPTCYKEDGTEIPGGFAMWNAAYALGGPACTIRQFEQLTDIRIDHFVTVDFSGFRDMVNAIDGVEICIPKDVHDYVGNIHLKAGTRMVKGQEALDYVRVRHNISSNGDIGRMKRQQAFVAAMANRVMSMGVLARPDRILGFLKAATKSLTLDHKLGTPKKIADLAMQFSDISLDEIKFITVPWDFYAPDPNRLVWAEDADLLWDKMRNDKPLTKRLSTEVISAAQRPGSTAGPDPQGDEPSGDPSSSESADPDAGGSGEPKTDTPDVDPDRTAIAAANGLCA